MWKSTILLAFIALFTLQSATCDTNVREEFREKFGAGLKDNVLQLFESGIKIMNDHYDSLLKESSITPTEGDVLRKNKAELEVVSKNIKTLNVPDLIETAKEVVNNKYRKFVNNLSDENERSKKFAQMAIEKGQTAGLKFSKDTYDLWKKLYETVPKQEHEQFPDYKRIDELMDDVKKTNYIGGIFINAVQEIIKFLGLREWNFVLEIQ